MVRLPTTFAAGGAALCLALAGCSTEETASQSASTGGPTVVTAMYPMQYIAESVGGDRINSVSLVEPGVDSHDLELTPQQIAEITEADVVVYASGLAPAVDSAVSEYAGDSAIDVLTLVPTLSGGGGHDHDEEGHSEDDHGHDDDHSDEEGHSDKDDHGHDDDHSDEEGHSDKDASVDPHVWLNPVNMVTISEAVTNRLIEVDADSADQYRADNSVLVTKLEELDTKWRKGTKNCSSQDLVVSHEAFGYLADRYGFEQFGISGLSPEEEPSPTAIAAAADFVSDNNVKTIYYESQVDPGVAQTVADETGAQTGVLDPLELAPQMGDYITVMRSNLAAVQEGQPCQ
jgi:zinc transport system substrate-binding protein